MDSYWEKILKDFDISNTQPLKEILRGVPPEEAKKILVLLEKEMNSLRDSEPKLQDRASRCITITFTYGYIMGLYGF